MNYSIVGIKSGNKLYISSKTKEVGFDTEVEYEGTTYYHKELSHIEGVLKNKKLEEGNYGERLKLFFAQDKDNTYVLEIPTLQGDSLKPWAAEIAKYLPGMDIGKNVKISTNTTKVDKKGNPYRNFYVEQDGVSVAWAFNLEDVPKPTQKKSKLKGEVTWDFTDRDAFLYEIITKSN